MPSADPVERAHLQRQLAEEYRALAARQGERQANLAATAQLSAAVKHLIRTLGHRRAFEIVSQAADMVLADEHGWPA